MRPPCSSCCWCNRTHILGLCRAGIVSHTSTSHLLTGCVRTLKLLLRLSDELQVVRGAARYHCDSRSSPALTSGLDNSPPIESTALPRHRCCHPPTSERILLERRGSESRWEKNEASVGTSSSRCGGLVRHKVAGRGVRGVGVIVIESEVNRICIQWAH